MPSSFSGVNSDDKNHANHVSITSSSVEGAELSFAEVCEKVHGKVDAFLDAEPKTERVRAVQAQTRRSLNVIEQALRRYR
jgi:FAD synthetase